MRVVRVLVPEDRREGWLDALDDRGVDYVVTAESSGRSEGVVVEFPLPTAAVGNVMDDLRDEGFDGEYTVITSAETATTENFDALQRRYSGRHDDSVDRTEIRAKAFTMTPNLSTYYVMTVLSAVVATAGLLLDSPAIVVGAMVIAPQVSAALTASIGTVLDDPSMIWQGFRALVLGLIVAVVGATIFAWAVRTMYFVPPALDIRTVAQIDRRIAPGVLAVAVGIGAGAAGAFGLATAVPLSIVGVMIAAALIPAAAAVGIGIAWGLPSVAIGAFVLLTVNAVLITLSAIVVLWWLGYRPDDWNDREFGDRLSVDGFDRGLAAIGVLLVVLVVSGGVIASEVHFDTQVNGEIERTLSEEQFSDLELVSVQTEFSDAGLTEEDRRISIVINRPADTGFPGLVEQLDDRISERTGTDVIVEIEYLEKESSDR